MRVRSQGGPDEDDEVRVHFECGCIGDFASPESVTLGGRCPDHFAEPVLDVHRQMVAARTAFVAEGLRRPAAGRTSVEDVLRSSAEASALFSAAPELFEALSALVEEHEDRCVDCGTHRPGTVNALYSAGRAALNKAGAR